MTGTEALLVTVAALIVLAGAWMMRSEAKAPTAPHEPEQETALKSEIAELRRRIDKSHADDEEMKPILRQLDRIEARVDAIWERAETDARIATAIDRISNRER